MIKYGILHNHTEHSIKDSVVTVEGLVKRGYELGAPAIALTDHGSMTGCYAFYNACKEKGIKPILGSELYVREEDESFRKHLIVMAKDYVGYQALMKCTKLSNKRLTKVGTLVFPEATSKILEECFGKGSAGYNHVIATSACISGVLAGICSEKNLQENLTSKEEIVAFMKSEALRYNELFGDGNFYIELQNHGMPSEKEWMYELNKISLETGIKICAANDAHLLDNSEESIFARQTIHSLRWNSLEEVSASEKECYIKEDEELFIALANIVGEERASEAIENIGIIVDDCNVDLPKNPMHYPVFDNNVDSLKILKEEIEKGIKERFPNGFPDKKLYEERISYELKVIEQLNVVDYLLIVQDLLRFGRKLGKMPEERFMYLSENIYEMDLSSINAYVDEDQSYFGYTVGPGRGSAGGSEICFILGITDIDPIPYNLLFERFLNPERVTMPDIDSDYAKGYREVVIAYTYKKYGEDAVCRIITFNTNSAKAAIRNVARALGTTKAKAYEAEEEKKTGKKTKKTKKDSDSLSPKEEIIKRYTAIGEKLAKICSGKPHDVLSNYDEEWARQGTIEKEIIKRAKSIEGSYSTYGMHACGVIISDNDNVNEYVPLSWDTVNSCFKTQCVPAEAEKQGLLKMDFLGLKNLNIITEVIRLIEKNHGIRINPSLIPVEPEVIKGITKEGRTDAIFQLESAGMKSLCIRLKPDSMEDVILGIAAYRPGPMDSIPEIIDVKSGKKTIKYDITELKEILDVTYGKPIYQEQIQQIFRSLAGYSFGQADNVRRAMSKKKDEILLAEREAFVYGDKSRKIDGCVARNIDAEKANKLFDEMTSFAKYAFNKSHAAVYARIAYIMMWLKYHYFIEFMAVAIKWASDKKRMPLINECREYGIKVLPPDINVSEEDVTTIAGNIMFGLSSIKGIVSVDKILETRREKPFDNFNDFIRRGHIKKNVTEALIWAGAFDSFGSSRKALELELSQLIDVYKDIKENEKKICECQDIIAIIKENADKPETEILKKLTAIGFKNKTVPTIEKKEKQIETYSENIDALYLLLSTMEEPSMFKDDKETNLLKEKELLGTYLTGHPTDSYEPSSECTSINDLQAGKNQTLFGAITNLRITRRKKDGALMAFFELEDKTGAIDVCCFTKEYSVYQGLISDFGVVEITGDVYEEEIEELNQAEDAEEDENAEEGESLVKKVLKVNVKKIVLATRKSRTFLITIDSLPDWNSIYPKAVEYSDKSNGASTLLVWDTSENLLRTADFKVRDNILLDTDISVVEI